MESQDAALNVRRSTRKVLEAVDWSKEGQAGGEPRRGRSRLRAVFGAAAQKKPLEQLRVLWLATQEYLEKFWQAGFFTT